MQSMRKNGLPWYLLQRCRAKRRKNDGLCLVCAKELHVPQIDEYMKQMGITDEELEQISNQMMDMMDGKALKWAAPV